MAAKVTVAFLVFLLGVVFGVVASSSLRSDGTEAPDLPANVPNSALWAGGLDGGMWVDCRPALGEALACRVYAHVTGSLVEEGEFVLDPKAIQPAFYSAGLIGAEVHLAKIGKLSMESESLMSEQRAE